MVGSPSTASRSKSNRVSAIPVLPCSIRELSRWKSGRPSAASATSSPSSWTPSGTLLRNSGSRWVMSQPRRLRARKTACVQERQRNPSSFGSNTQPGPPGISPEWASTGSGSRRATKPSLSCGRRRRAAAVRDSRRRPPRRLSEAAGRRRRSCGRSNGRRRTLTIAAGRHAETPATNAQDSRLACICLVGRVCSAWAFGGELAHPSLPFR